MNDDVATTLARASRVARRLSGGLSRRVKTVVSRSSRADQGGRSVVGGDSDAGGIAVETPPTTTDDAPKPAPDPAQEAEQVRKTSRGVAAELKEVTAARARLRQERLSLQRLLGEQHGKSVMPRLKVEKTNGTASFVVGQRMMQRTYRRGLDPAAGLDEVGTVLGNPEATGQFARGHGVPTAAEGASHPERTTDPENDVAFIVHAFKGEVGLLEVRGPHGVRHFDTSGEDVGDIRPAATYDPALQRAEPFEDVCTWSRVLSAAIPRPYAQVVFRPAGDSVVLDHIDVDPDRIPVLTPAWDERLGAYFDSAYSRFLLQPYRAGALANRVPGGTFTYEEGA